MSSIFKRLSLPLVLVAGTIFAWVTVLNDVRRFYNFYGTIVKFTNCVVPNPLITPCFYGAIAFLVALVWASAIRKNDPTVYIHKLGYLINFLIAGNLFAWTNTVLLIYRYIQAHGKPFVGCSGLVATNPFLTPCFIGSCLFLLALIVGVIIRRAEKRIIYN